MKALIAFEAVARLGSMTAAAQELGISQPAVSQLVRALEDTVGVPLFERRGTRTRATAAGRRYYADISASVHNVASATQCLQSSARGKKSDIAIAAHFGVVHLWLLPLLPRLKSAFPALRIGVLSTDHDDTPEMGTADLTIRFGNFDDQPSTAHTLFADEAVFPVCSPALARSHGIAGMLTAKHLASVPLLHLDTHDSRWLDWYRWCENAGLPPPAHQPAFTWNNYPLLLNAAISGDGIALGWTPLVRKLVDEGALNALGPTVRRRGHGYMLHVARHGPASVTAVAKWLLRAAADETTTRYD